MKKEIREYELVVQEGKRPIYMIILAALFFTLMLYGLYGAALHIYDLGLNAQLANIIPKDIKLIAFCLAGGISFSATKTVLIDIDSDLLISRFYVGPFSKDVISKVPELEYVSVFLDSSEEFQVNLWYVGNKHYKMYCFEEKEPAMKFAEIAAQKLNIDLLDATEKGNSKWIEAINKKA